MPSIQASDLTDFATELLSAGGVGRDEARQVAQSLVGANLRGHDSHGVGMIPRYVAALRDGGLRANRTPRVTLDTGPLLGIDGVCIICHGSSNDRAIANALGVAAQDVRVRLNEKIVAELETLPEAGEGD